MTLDEANAEAIRRIRAAKESGQWWLDLGDLPIERVPDEIAELSRSLRVLALGGGGGLTVTGEKWSWHPALTAGVYVSIRYGTLADVQALRGLGSLTALSLHGCSNLADLSPLRNLSALEVLDLNGCSRLTSVEPLGNLTALVHLDLSWCPQLEALRPITATLRQLRSLYLQASRVPDLHPSVCNRWLELDHDSESTWPVPTNVAVPVGTYFAALGPDAKPDAEVKLFVLGNGRCGKTKLIGRLKGLGYDQVPGGSTHGATVESWQVPEAWGLPHPVRLCVWDFGGQDIYHGTHALFLREPAVYALLFADATENEDAVVEGGFAMQNRRLPYWFDYLRQEAGSRGVVSSPVLLTQTQCDVSGEATRPPFVPPGEQFPHLSPLIHTSAKDEDGLDHFLPRLKRSIKDLLRKYPQPPMPASWEEVRRNLREWQRTHARRTMTLGEFGEVCGECGCRGDERVLLDALAVMGVVFHREGVFDDRIVVDLTWVLDAIYTLFKRDHKFQRKIDSQRGRFTREDLELFFWGEHPVEDQRTFLGFMEECGICFRTHDRYTTEYEGEYVIPDKLPAWGADHEGQFRRQLADFGGVEVSAMFTLLHDGIARGFLSRIGSVAGDVATYWRSGCHLLDGATDAEAMIRADGNALRIRTWGKRAGELAQRLVRVVKDVPSSQSPVVTWSTPSDQPTRIEPDHDGKPENRLDPVFGPKSVFFSYRHPHADHAGSERGRLLLRELRELLERDGWTVRLDERELKDGDSISAFIDQARACAFLVPVFCERYFDSRYTLSELFAFREKFAADAVAFADRTVPVFFAEGGLQSDLKQAEAVERCRALFAAYEPSAGTFALAPEVYKRVYALRSWGERLGEILAALSDRLNTPTAEAVAERLNRTFARLNPTRA